MKFDLDIWSEIFTTITRNKMRSFLTAFGVFWGIFMLTIMLGGGVGLKNIFHQNLSVFNTNPVFFVPNGTTESYQGLPSGRQWSINVDDSYAVSHISGVKLATGNIRNWGTRVESNGETTNAAVIGVFPEISEVQKINFIDGMGRLINRFDLESSKKVCIIGDQVYNNLFPNKDDAIGKLIKINGTYYTCIGVNKAENSISFGGNASNEILVPYTAFVNTFSGSIKKGDLSILACTFEDGVDIEKVRDDISTELKRRHRIAPTDDKAMFVLDVGVMYQAAQSIFGGLDLLIWLVGLGTLIAGIIGVSNILMVTVKERTTEIGIRRAIGARKSDVWFQIILESIILTLISGAIGITVSVLILQGVEKVVQFTGTEASFQISFLLAVSMLFVLAVLGVLAGLMPAYRAINIKPIDAIRDN